MDNELERLQEENWQLRGALGYPVPGHIREGNFRCMLCEAKTVELIELRAIRDFIMRVFAGCIP